MYRHSTNKFERLILCLLHEGHAFANLQGGMFEVSSSTMCNTNVPTEQVPNGLPNDQVRRYHDYFPGMVSLDYFLD
jgi:hypothetical protein